MADYVIDVDLDKNDRPTLSGLIVKLGLVIINGDIANGVYDEVTKETAQKLISVGIDAIPIQCLANGNLDLPEEVIAETKVHIGLLCDKQGQKEASDD